MNKFAETRSQGDADYIGEQISQLEHSLQAAGQAVLEGKRFAQSVLTPGADEETVVAALLHDIGQFVPHTEAKDMMHEGGSLGKMSHEAVGEKYLRDLGFPDKVCSLVGAHVVAKRYLTAVHPGYLDSLSSASKASLKYQGGPFSPAQVTDFLQDPLHKEKVQLRLWDDRAKRVDWKAPGLETYRPMIMRVLERAS